MDVGRCSDAPAQEADAAVGGVVELHPRVGEVAIDHQGIHVALHDLVDGDARHRIDPGGAELVWGCNGIGGQLLGDGGIPVGDIDARLGKAGVCASGLGAGIAGRVAENGDTKEWGDYGLEVGACRRIFPKSGGEVRTVAHVVGGIAGRQLAQRLYGRAAGDDHVDVALQGQPPYRFGYLLPADEAAVPRNTRQPVGVAVDDVEADPCLGLLLVDDGEQIVEMPALAVACPLVEGVGIFAPLVQDDEVPRLLGEHAAHERAVLRIGISIGCHHRGSEHPAEVVGLGVEVGMAVGPRLERPAAARQLVQADPLHVDAAAFGYHLQHSGVVVGIGVADVKDAVGFLSIHRLDCHHGEAKGLDGVKMNR